LKIILKKIIFIQEGIIIKTKELIDEIVKTAEEKKGENIEVIKLRTEGIIIDYFIIITASSKMNARAVSDAIVMKLKELNNPKRSVQGHAEGSWILIDTGNIFIHIFTGEQRSFYNLEKLWKQSS